MGIHDGSINSSQELLLAYYEANFMRQCLAASTDVMQSRFHAFHVHTQVAVLLRFIEQGGPKSADQLSIRDRIAGLAIAVLGIRYCSS